MTLKDWRKNRKWLLGCASKPINIFIASYSLLMLSFAPIAVH